MYIGAKDINLLDGFLNGIFYALQAYDIEEEWLFEGFHEWVADYYNFGPTSFGWKDKDIILKECDGEVALAADIFFKLYDLFRADKQKN